MSLEIKALHKNAFREIFNLIDKDKVKNKKQLISLIIFTKKGWKN